MFTSINMKIKKAWLIDIEGAVTRLPQLENKELSLKDMYPIIGNRCHLVERVQLKKGVDMWVDEEGLLKENTQNNVATFLYRQVYAGVNNVDLNELLVVGNAIIIDNTKTGDFIIEHTH